MEKIQVQLTAAAAVLVVYFAAWRALRPSDPEGPLTFIATGSYAEGTLFCGVVWVLAAICALLTVSARPESALVAALIGAAGASARSAQMRTLLWRWEDNLAGLYCILILEVLALCVLLLMAAVIVDVLRALIGRLKPNWLWRPTIPKSQGPARGRASADAGRLATDRPGPYASARGSLILCLLRSWTAARAGGDAGKRLGHSASLRKSLSCLGLGLLIAVVLLILLMQSPDRGQILFALLAAFIIASLVAHQAFPTPHSVVLWGTPMLVAVGFYALAAFSVGREHGSWTRLMNYARALPVDWLTAGCGGALIGYWVSERIHEIRHIERAEKDR